MQLLVTFFIELAVSFETLNGHSLFIPDHLVQAVVDHFGSDQLLMVQVVPVHLHPLVGDVFHTLVVFDGEGLQSSEEVVALLNELV